MSKLEDVLAFIRGANPEIWNLLMRECVSADRGRDVRLSRQLNIGDRIRFVGNGEVITGVIEKVSHRRGRIQVKTDDGSHCGLPAGLVELTNKIGRV